MKICLTCDGVTDADDRLCAHCGVPLLAEHEVALPHRRGDESGPHPLSGRVFDGKYRLEGVLGRGGMGTVFRAVHEVSHAPVAVKILNPRYASRSDHRDWFVAEARRASRVVHENSARIQDVGITPDGIVYLASELCDGETLRELLDRRRLVAPAFAVDLLRQLAEGLDAAHRAGVVHRDLTPRNVMVAVRDGAPRVKIVDFGIAAGESGPEAMRARGVSNGRSGSPTGFANPPYTAPEQLAGEPIDGRADLYALGVIAYELLTGEWPVDGDAPGELIEATRGGRTRRLRATGGVPSTLAALIGELLAVDPLDRPRDAAEVAERLWRIRSPRTRSLGAVAALSLVASVSGFALAHLTGSDDVFLHSRPGGGLVLTASPDGEAGTRRSIRTEDLLASTFRCGGLDPAELLLEASRDGEVLARLPIGPSLLAVGDALRIRSSAAAGWVARLAELSTNADIDVAIGVDAAPPLGYARVRIDDTAPEVRLDVELAAGDALLGDGWVGIAAADDDAIAELFLEVRLLGEDGSVSRVVQVPVDPAEASGLRSQALDLLGARFPPPRDRGRAELTLIAIDRAGNRATFPTVRTAALDLGAPSIERVTSTRGDRLVVDRPDGARLRLALTGSEPGLVVQARLPGHEGWIEFGDARVLGDRLELRLPPRRGADKRQPSGVWAFRLRDHAGNHGAVFEEQLTFRGVDAAVELAFGSPRPSAWVDGALVYDGEAARLEIACNPIYRPAGWRLRTPGGGELAAGELVESRPGGGRIDLGLLPPGSHELEVTLREERGEGGSESRRWSLRALRDPVRLRLPDTAGLRHLPALVAASVLRDTGTGFVAGSAWRWTPDDPRFLDGRIWSGGDGVLAATAWSTDAVDPIGALAVERGSNLVAVELSDVLGRPVEVWLGERRAPTVDLPGGAVGQVVARFRHHDAALAFARSEARVEFGQGMRLALRSALPLEDAAGEVELWVAGGRSAPAAVRREADGRDLLLFEVPFDRVVIAADLGGVPDGEYRFGVPRTLRCTARSAFGEQRLEVPVRTIRSTLVPLQLGELAPDLPAALAAIRLLPVLGPGIGGVVLDPLPADLPQRRRIRPMPPIEVRNVPDVYVQDRELTCGEWDAIVRVGLERIASAPPAVRAAVVHDFDPLGARRLTRAALLPHDVRDETASWDARVAIGREAPVTGIDAFQAFTVARLAGWIVRGDPQLLRLPFGVELEMAALGGEATARNGAAAHGPGLSLSALRRFANTGEAPTAAECVAIGDVVDAGHGAGFRGLDAGVLEWVEDLPFMTDRAGGEALLVEWLGDHVLHRRRVRELATGAPLAIPDDLVSRLATYGVVRGVAFDDGRTLGGAPRRGDRITVDFPGVTRVTQIRRDGAGLVPAQTDPRLLRVGMRLAGGERFVREVRNR